MFQVVSEQTLTSAYVLICKCVWIKPTLKNGFNKEENMILHKCLYLMQFFLKRKCTDLKPFLNDMAFIIYLQYLYRL